MENDGTLMKEPICLFSVPKCSAGIDKTAVAEMIYLHIGCPNIASLGPLLLHLHLPTVLILLLYLWLIYFRSDLHLTYL